ncbi:hypothetical protein [Polynucleobacter sp.]|jgi:hypothetical protein
MLIQIGNGFQSSARFADHLDDLGDLQGLEDSVTGFASRASAFVAK